MEDPVYNTHSFTDDKKVVDILLQVEIKGMKKSHIRDAVALIEFADLLESELRHGKSWDELKAAKVGCD